jgi:hypothetical protein
MISKGQKWQGFVGKPGEERSCRGYSVTGKDGPHEVRIKSAMKQHLRHVPTHFSCGGRYFITIRRVLSALLLLENHSPMSELKGGKFMGVSE